MNEQKEGPSVLTDSDLRELTMCANYVIQGGSCYARLVDTQLIDVLLQSLKGFVNNNLYKKEGVNPYFEEYDFRYRGIDDIAEAIRAKYGYIGPKWKQENPDKIILIVAPSTLPGQEDQFMSVLSLAKWAPTIVVRTRPNEDGEPIIKKLLAEYTDYQFIIGQQLT